MFVVVVETFVAVGLLAVTEADESEVIGSPVAGGCFISMSFLGFFGLLRDWLLFMVRA